MTKIILGALTVGLLSAGSMSDEQSAKRPASTVPRTADGHPDLSGGWTYAIDIAPVALKKVINGETTTIKVDQSARHGVPIAHRGRCRGPRLLLTSPSFT